MEGKLILLVGRSTTGKSHSLKGLRDSDKVAYLNCESGKHLPFKNNFQRFIVTEPKTELIGKNGWLGQIANHPNKVHTVVIDSLTFLMDMYETKYVKTATNTQTAWGGYADFFINLINQEVPRLIKAGIPTHYIKTLNDTDQLCYKVDIFPLEVITRNIIAGSMAKRLGITEGTVAKNTIFEICYKNDELGDPLINDHHAVAVGAATYDELKEIYSLTSKINDELKKMFLEIGVKLVDFKVEFGRTSDGRIVLADEISPDCCRLWDAKTNDHLDKDRFRRDLGDVMGAYEEIYARLQKLA